METLIQADGIAHFFGSRAILKNVSLNVEAQKTLVLIGPSGQGKSLLLKILAGLILPDKGQILYEGRERKSFSRSEWNLYLRKIGMLFQKNALFDSMSCFNNVAFPLRQLTSLNESEINERALGFLEAVGLIDARDKFPDEISGGMQKRLGIARALALEPKIVFYDDPTAGLDPITSRKIIDLILFLKEKNQSTVVAVTNEMNRAYQMADRLVLVAQQQALSLGTPAEAQKNSNPDVHRFLRGQAQGPGKPETHA